VLFEALLGKGVGSFGHWAAPRTERRGNNTRPKTADMLEYFFPEPEDELFEELLDRGGLLGHGGVPDVLAVGAEALHLTGGLLQKAKKININGYGEKRNTTK